MDVRRRRKLIGWTVAVVAVCGGAAAIAATELGSPSKHLVVSGAFGGAVTPNAPTPLTPAPGGLGGGLYGGNRGGFGGGFRGGFGGNLTTAASYLGVTISALESNLQSGKTLAQIAKDNGKTAGGLISALVAAEKKQLDSAVSAGNLTAAQAQQFESFLTQRITDLVNGTRPIGRGGGGFGGGDDGGGFGPGGGSGGSGSGQFGSSTA